MEISRGLGTLFAQTLRCAYRSPWRGEEIMLAVVQQGVGSLPIVAVSTAFAGMVVSNEIAWHLDRALGSVTMIPGVTGQFIMRELGTSIPALLLVAKVGASTAAEVGSMKITEQIDALRLLRVDPVAYLVFPRFVASIISTACLTLIAVAVTLGCALGIAVWRYGFSMPEYINALRHFIGYADLLSALVKGVCFGAVIPVIACWFGMNCKGGAEGVGSATTDAVVTATLAVIAIDFALTFAFSGWLGG